MLQEAVPFSFSASRELPKGVIQGGPSVRMTGGSQPSDGLSLGFGISNRGDEQQLELPQSRKANGDTMGTSRY